MEDSRILYILSCVVGLLSLKCTRHPKIRHSCYTLLGLRVTICYDTERIGNKVNGQEKLRSYCAKRVYVSRAVLPIEMYRHV